MPLDGPQARAALAKLRENIAAMERQAKVLIVDDSAADAILLSKDIQKVAPSAVVDVAQTKAEADALCAHNCYDVIFLDLLLPGPSGVDLLKDSPCFARGEGHLIVLTGLDASSELVKDIMSAGAKVIFQKPISDRQLNLIFGKIP